MAVFRVVVTAADLLLGLYIYCFLARTMKFYGLNVKKAKSRIFLVVLAAIIALSLRDMRKVRTMVILHILVFAMLLDVAAKIGKILFRPLSKARAAFFLKKLYGCGLLPFLFAGALLTYGAFNMGRVVKTEYEFQTEKLTGDYKIVLITDTHYGTIQDTEILKNKIEEINAEKPDLVILGGDIVEEGTSKEQMQEVFQVLGSIENRYGIYYVYGNHDRQSYTQNRSYTDEELDLAITESGITILEDEYTEINQELILAGRGDAAWGNSSGRASTEEILEGVDREKYIIVADHQPIGAEENDEQGADLQVSGHTHGGQIWPVGIFSGLIGILNYGEYESGNCKVIVSSGFTGWGYPIRTEEKCEYVVIRIGAETE